MNPPALTAELEDHESMARLSAWAGMWDPSVAVARPPHDATLYEPDATLVGVAAGQPMTIRLSHRERRLRAGDAIVVPAGLALEIEPEVDLLAVSCSGQAPDHFRERFIQVWGYDHFAAPEPPGGPAALVPVIPAEDLRYRVHSWITTLHEPGQPLGFPGDELDLTLVLGIQGRVGVKVSEAIAPIELGAGQVLGVAPGFHVEFSGAGRAGVLRVVSEAAFHARRALQGALSGQFPSPEAAPRRHNPLDSPPLPGNSP